MSLIQSIVLILLDRDFDLGTMVLHSWTYQALIHDLFDIKLNQVHFAVSGPEYTYSYNVNIIISNAYTNIWPLYHIAKRG